MTTTTTPTPREGTQTPWGPAQFTETIAPGLIFAGTAGHGGMWVAPALLHRVRAVAKRFPGFDLSARRRWFEEDCEISLIVLAFPEHHTARQIECAELAAAHWYGGAT